MSLLRALLATLVLLAVSSVANATPFYALESANRCNSCHVEPIGWANPGMADRRCNLDCSGCHISPTGGGMRTPMGRFYGEEVLPMWGSRPSSEAAPMRFYTEGYPTEGRYSLTEGFEGWWAGEVSHREIEDRYGSINPSPVYQAGGDARAMLVVPTDDSGRDVVAFPMELQAYLAAHPASNITLYADVGVQGSTRAGEDDGPSFSEQLWGREVFAMIHDGPYASYARVGRFALPYGWRVPDHTQFGRTGVMDMYRQGYGLELGFAHNEGWGNLAFWRQGLDGWPGDHQAPGNGMSLVAGVRRLGFTAGWSAHAMDGSDETPDELMTGPMWGLNLHPVILMGEASWLRHTTIDTQTDSVTMMTEARFAGIRGITPRLRWDFTDSDVLYALNHRNRYTFGFDFNPIRYVQLAADYRVTVVPEAEAAHEVLAQIHFWGM